MRFPSDGEYVVQIRDSIYRGREDFVYRITLGELPYVTSIFPFGGPAAANHRGTPRLESPVDLAHVDYYGAGHRASFGAQGGSDFKPRAVCGGHLAGMPGKGAERLAATAQTVTLPIIVNGRIDKTGDWDVFRFAGRAGEPSLRKSMPAGWTLRWIQCSN